MLMSLSLIAVSLSKQNSPLTGLLPEEPVLCVVLGPLGAVLEDVVVELGTVAAGEDRDEVSAGVVS